MTCSCCKVTLAEGFQLCTGSAANLTQDERESMRLRRRSGVAGIPPTLPAQQPFFEVSQPSDSNNAGDDLVLFQKARLLAVLEPVLV